MPVAVVLLIVVVALARGGYSPWGMLALELGAVGLLLWAVVEVLWDTRPEEREIYLEQQKAWKQLPFRARHPWAGSLVRLLSLGRLSNQSSTDVEILLPGHSAPSVRRKPVGRYLVLWGFPFKKTHLAWPLVLLTLWIVMSLVPMEGDWLERLSPRAHALRAEAEVMAGSQSSMDSGPWSLAPFLTLRGLWLWLANVALIFVGAHIAASSRRAERLSQLLFLTGIGFGLYGMAQWLFGLQELFGADPTTAHLRASGSFGNRNHYAAFMEMLLLCGLGWVGMRHAAFQTELGTRRGRNFFRRIEEAGSKLFFLGLGVVIVSLGLIFSLSRAGITFALVGCALFVLLRPLPEAAGTIDLPGPSPGRSRWFSTEGRRRKVHGLVALALAVVGVAAWIGLDPVVHRFQLLPDEWEAEQSRVAVWSDSLEAVPDFALTGSGLSTYRYVFPIYRTFGGRRFYSWAHNDYLQVLIELGVPGLLLVLWIMAAVWHGATWVRGTLQEKPALLHLHAGYLAAVAAIALHSFTDFGLHLPANAALLSVIVGVTVGLEPPADSRTRSREKSRPGASA